MPFRAFTRIARPLISADADADQIRRASTTHVHTRILVRTDKTSRAHSTYATRSPVRARSAHAADIAHPIPTLHPDSGVLDTLTTMRNARAQLAVIATPDHPFIGLVSLDDLLGELLAANPH